jgi:uncharacterized membrane protein
MAQVEPSAEMETSEAAAKQIKMDVLVGTILLAGVLLSMILVVVGMFWKWKHTGSVQVNYPLKGMNLFQLVVQEIHLTVHGDLRPRLFINLGIVVLMLTPYLRVMASVGYFFSVLKNWKYTLFTSIVLIVLTYSLFLR